MRRLFENVTTTILVICAVTVTTLAARREVRTYRVARSPTPYANPRQFKEWKSFEAIGRRVGAPDAPATILEFVDYECPACRAFSSELARIVALTEQKHPGKLATVFVHFPLPMHRFAKIAGQAVECADGQGRFTSMQRVLFAKQDSFGLKPWSAYAREAGVPDSLAFATCMSDSTSSRKVVLGLQLAERLKLPATPTILLNGWQFIGVPQGDQLEVGVERLLTGEKTGDTLRRGVAVLPSK